MEEGIDFPVTYEDVTYEATLAMAGADITIPVAETLKWNIGFEVERMLGNPSVDFVGQAAYIGKVDFSADLEKTWGSLNTGFKYDLNDRVAIGVSASLEGTALGNAAFGGQLSLSGKF